MPSEAAVGDTVVIVDVSWPIPDNIEWEYPNAMTTLLNLGEMIYGRFEESGIYEVTLRASLAQCVDEITKRISILESRKGSQGGRLGYEKFVKKFNLFPNPNDGYFEVLIELAEESPVTLSVWSLFSGRSMGQISIESSNYIRQPIDFRPATSGTYILRLDHKKGSELLRFVVR